MTEASRSISRPPTISSLISSAAAHLCAASIAALSSRVSVLYWSGGVALRAIGFSGDRPHSRMVWRYFPASRILVASDSRKRGTCRRGRMWGQIWEKREGRESWRARLIVTCAGASVNRFCQYAHA